MMKINSETLIFSIISNPIRQVVTPGLINEIFQYNNENAVYIPMNLTGKQIIEDYFSMVKATSNFMGGNVSIPYKQCSAKYIDSMSETAKTCNAINTFYKNDSGIFGDNFDGLGYVKSIKEEKEINIQGKSILIRGSGGAAISIINSLIREMPDEILILNRTLENALKIKNNYSNIYDKIKCLSIEDINKGSLENIDLFINTTPLGLRKSDPLPIDINILPDDVIISDIVMSPTNTSLIKLARKQGKNTFTGDNMIIYQINEMLRVWGFSNLSIGMIREFSKRLIRKDY